MTQDDFLNRCQERHPDEGYTYEHCHYVRSNVKVAITCPIHGDFLMQPCHFVNGEGCPKCASNHLMTQDEFIRRAREIHGDKYRYDHAVYVGWNYPITITCPIHGDFTQHCGNHLKGMGCKECMKERFSRDNKISHDDFMRQLTPIMNPLWDYSQVRYVDRLHKVKMICPKHGEFMKRPQNLLIGGGCPRCRRKVSTGERQVATWMESMGYKVVRNDRVVIAPKELDIWAPDERVAIEYCGDYWHRLPGMDVTHSWKRDQCAARGIRLLFISDSDWMSGRGKQIILAWLKSTRQCDGIDARGNLL